MKRTEALKILAKFIKEEFDPNMAHGHEDLDLSLAYAVSIMELIEDGIGMEPPRDSVLLRNRWEKE